MIKKYRGIWIAFFILVMMFYPTLTSAQSLPGGMQQITVPTTASGASTIRAALSLPDDYASTSQTYPLLVFFHGAGEAGTALSKIYTNSSSGGPLYHIAQGTFPTSFSVDGQTHKFIVVAPQTGSWSTRASYVPHILNNLVANYRVDTNRIYLTGLSAGGEATVGYASHYDPEIGSTFSPSYTAAAIVPMSAASGAPAAFWGTNTVADNTKVWGFGSPSDSHGNATEAYVNAVNAAGSGFAKFTSYSGGHCCWSTYYNPSYNGTAWGSGMSIYEWMLQHSLGGSTPPPEPTNQSPNASAGSDQTITGTSVTLSGSGSDPDGSIESYAWTKISGGSVSIQSPSSMSTQVTGLSAGTYTFWLTVTDNQGATDADAVTVTVTTSANAAPTANAGSDQTTTQTSVTLSGSGSDPDGSIASYAWTKVSGTGGSIASPSSASTAVTGLSAGTYTFRLTVTDNQGATDTDDVTVLIEQAGSGSSSGQSFLIDFGNTDRQTTANGWNNVVNPSTGTTLVLKDTTGVLTAATLRITDGLVVSSSSSYSANTNGSTSGPYPSTATADAHYVTPNSGDSSGQVLISGLGSSNYTVKLYASRMATDSTNRTTVYTVNGNSAELNVSNNVSGVATVTNVAPIGGTITITVGLKPGATYAYLGIIDIQAQGGAVQTPSNVTPTANAGSNQTITLPTNSIILSGSGSDSDGSIASYAWTKVSGTGGSIASPSSASTAVTGLSAGTYTFRLTVTDNQGATDTDDVTVTVSTAPVLPAGGKTVTLVTTSTGEIYKSDLSSYNIQPCDVVQIPAGNYPGGIAIGMTSGFNGTADCPVTIINSGGQVTAPFLRIYNATYFKLTGSGSTMQYGFKIGGNNGNSGVSITEGTSDYEVERIEIYGVEVGIFGKITPVAGKPQTQYPNWVIKNVKLHDLYIHDTNGEGMYIGHTYPNGDPYSGGLVPVRMQNVKIYNNLVENTTWDGIQLSNAREGAEIYNNTVRNFGTFDIGSQQAGIILGGNTNGKVYNNTIDTGTGNALELFGYGDLQAYDNIIKNAPTTLRQGKQETVYFNDNSGLVNIEQNPAQRITFTNNVVTTSNGINQRSAILNARNNGTTLPGSISYNTICDAAGRTLSDLIRTNAGDLMVGNTLNSSGCSGVTPTPTNNAPTASAGSNQAITLPTNAVTLFGSGSDSDGTIVSYLWTRLNGSGTITAASSATTTVTGLTQGTSTFRLTVTDNRGATATDDVLVTVNASSNNPPTVNAGADQTVSLPLATATLSGTATDMNGSITSYYWSKVSGPGTIISATAQTTLITGLIPGTAVFRLTVTDNLGATATDDVTITILAANDTPIPTPPPSGGGGGGGGGGSRGKKPTALAGSDVTIALPIDSVVLVGAGDDADGSVTYRWKKTSGSGGTIEYPTRATTTVKGLKRGTYSFTLTVTDTDGNDTTDTVTVTVLPEDSTAPVSSSNSTASNTTTASPSSGGGSSSSRIRTTASVLNVRSAPNGTLLTKVPAGTQGTLLATTAGWYQVQFDGGSTGWVSSSYATVTTATATPSVPSSGSSSGAARVIASMLNVRSAPISGAVVTQLPLNTTVTILSTVNGWSQIQLPTGGTGYVSAAYLAGLTPSVPIPVPSTPTTTFTVGQTVTTTASNLNVRTAPGGAIITQVPYGTQAVVLSQSGEWLSVRFSGGTTGYVSAGYVR